MLQQMLAQALQQLRAGLTSPEEFYLFVLGLLEQAETTVNELVSAENLDADDALLVGEAKQRILEAFTRFNGEATLKYMRERAAADGDDQNAA